MGLIVMHGVKPMKSEEKTDWLDFKEIKANTDVKAVLDHFELLQGLGEQRNKDGTLELVGWCPLGTKRHGKKDSFAFNLEKKTFQCFACKNRGSVIDFVAVFESKHIRESARLIAEINSGVSTDSDVARQAVETHGRAENDAVEQTATLPEKSRFESADASKKNDDPREREDVDRLLKGVMTMSEAIERVRAGKVNIKDLVVVDVVAYKFFDRILN